MARNIFHSIKKTYLKHHASFQDNMVEHMNPNTEKASELWITSVSKHDEITNDGFAHAILDILGLLGIV